MMLPWQQQSLNLQVGDWIIWQDEAIYAEEGPAVLSPGMRGRVISLHDSFYLDVVQGRRYPAESCRGI